MTLKITGTGAVNKWQGPDVATHGFDVATSEVDDIVSGGEESTVIEKDLAKHVINPVTYNREYDINVSALALGALGKGYTVKSLTPGIATTENGRVQYVSDGTAIIAIDTPYMRRTVRLHVQQVSEATKSFPKGWADGSLAGHIFDGMAAMIADKSGEDDIAIYSTRNPAANIEQAGYVRNNAAWSYLVDMSGVSPWSVSADGPSHRNRRAGTLIAPDACLLTDHYPHREGDQISFVDNLDCIHTAEVVAQKRFDPQFGASGWHVSNDVQVCRLGFDDPHGLKHYKLLPADINDYLPNMSSTIGLPCICHDQFQQATIADMAFALETVTQFRKPPLGSDRRPFYRDKIDGDSSQPAFALINGEAVLLTVWTHGGAGAGPPLHALHGEINSALSEVGSAYQIEVVNLTGFPNYGG